MKGLSSGGRKAKGRRLQKLVEEMIAELTGLSAGKDEDIQSRPMGRQNTGPDIILSPRARQVFPFTVECKNKENWNLPSAIAQCQHNCYPNTDWLVVLGKNNTKPVVVLDAEVFFRLLHKIKRRERTKF